MPTVLVTGLATHDVGADLTDIGRALADAIGAPHESVWVYWQPAAAVAVGPRLARTPYGHCPHVLVHAREGRDDATVAAGLTAVANAVATALGVPLADVFAVWTDVAPSRVFTGGALLG
jgi:phenylpyruvate tautomerase PptA (4-oxalocrotonate tautomerase family)